MSSFRKDTSTGVLQTHLQCHSPRGPALSDPHGPLFSTSPYKLSSWPQCPLLWVLPEPHFLPIPLPTVVSCFRSGQHGAFWGHRGGPKAKPALSASSDLGGEDTGWQGDHKVGPQSVWLEPSSPGEGAGEMGSGLAGLGVLGQGGDAEAGDPRCNQRAAGVCHSLCSATSSCP